MKSSESEENSVKQTKMKGWQIAYIVCNKWAAHMYLMNSTLVFASHYL